MRLIRIGENRGVGLKIDGGRVDAAEEGTEVVVRRCDALLDVRSLEDAVVRSGRLDLRA